MEITCKKSERLTLTIQVTVPDWTEQDVLKGLKDYTFDVSPTMQHIFVIETRQIVGVITDARLIDVDGGIYDEFELVSERVRRFFPRQNTLCRPF